MEVVVEVSTVEHKMNKSLYVVVAVVVVALRHHHHHSNYNHYCCLLCNSNSGNPQSLSVANHSFVDDHVGWIVLVLLPMMMMMMKK